MNTTPQNTPFKQTEIGPIPQDWEVKKIGDIAIKVGSGITPTGGEKVYTNQGRPFLRSQNVGWGKFLLDDIAFISDEIHNTFSSTEIVEKDVFLNITGASIGRSAVADERVIGGNVNQHVCIIRADQGQINPYFLNAFLLSKKGQKQIDNFQAGGNRQGLNFGQIKSLQIPLPPTKAEQTAIATALSDADALIGSLEKLIHKKRLLKQATMQHLLTPKEDWEVKKLGEIAEIDPENLNSSTKPDYTFQYISLEDVDCGTLRNTTEMQFMNAPSRARRKLRKNDILVSTVRPNLKSHLHIKTEIKDWICSTGFCVLRCNEYYANSSFVFNHFFGSSINSQIDNLITGSNYPAINSRDVKNLEISFPPLAEQTRIATILSDMDAELSGLEGKLEKYRQLKQGMMQQLLTGKIRLVG